MTKITLEEEAEECRRKALSYLGRPEASHLLRVAREFDRLAAERDQHGNPMGGLPVVPR